MFLRCPIFLRPMLRISCALGAGFFSYHRKSSYFGTDTMYIEVCYNQRGKHSANGWKTLAHYEQAWKDLKKLA